MIHLPFKRGARDAPIEYPDGAEMNALLKSIDRTRPAGQRDYALFALMFNTGARVQEILNLRRRDVRLDAPCQVRLLGKGNKVRLCPLWPATAKLLRDLVGPRPASDADPSDALLFTNARGQPLTRFGVRYLLRKYVAAASRAAPTLRDKHLHPHSLRHGTAVALLKSDSGTPVADIGRQLGVSEASFYHWRKKFGSLGTSGMRDMRQLREENARLKRLVADLTLDKHILGEVLRKKFEAGKAPHVGWLDSRAIPHQHTARVPAGTVLALGVLPPQHEAGVRGTAAAHARPRFGCRRITVLLRREGWPVNYKQIHRLYQLEGLHLRMRVRRRKHMCLHRGVVPRATRPIEPWSMDFVHGQILDGRPMRVLTVVDQFTRLTPLIEPRLSFKGRDVAAALERVTTPGRARCRSGSIMVQSSSPGRWSYSIPLTRGCARQDRSLAR